MSKTIVILGGGWGGLTAAHALRGLVPKDYRIAVIEKRQSFVFYPSFLLRRYEKQSTNLNALLKYGLLNKNNENTYSYENIC